MYNIDNTAVPARVGGYVHGPLSLDGFPFGALEVGQSFFVANVASGRAKAVPFALAKKTYTDRKFRRVAATIEVQETNSETNEVTTKTVKGFRYGRIK